MVPPCEITLGRLVLIPLTLHFPLEAYFFCRMLKTDGGCFVEINGFWSTLKPKTMANRTINDKLEMGVTLVSRLFTSDPHEVILPLLISLFLALSYAKCLFHFLHFFFLLTARRSPLLQSCCLRDITNMVRFYHEKKVSGVPTWPSCLNPRACHIPCSHVRPRFLFPATLFVLLLLLFFLKPSALLSLAAPLTRRRSVEAM